MDIPSYISGYVDGEGCFTVSFSTRIHMRVGWEVRPSFSVSQNGDRSEVLELMLEYFGCGSIRPDRSDKTLKYDEVRDIHNLMTQVVPHLERYPLQSGKQKDFEQLAVVCRLMHGKAHLTSSGLRQIVEVAMTMNAPGRRRFTAVEILDASEPKVIVSASSNRG